MKIKDMYIGMGATIYHWSDRTPATIIQILQDGKRLLIQEDKYTRLDHNGCSEQQDHLYEADANGTIHEVSLRKDGQFKISNSQTIVSLGARRRYYDYSF